RMTAGAPPRVTAADLPPVVAPPSTDDLLRRLLHHAGEVLNLAHQLPGICQRDNETRSPSDNRHLVDARHPGDSWEPAAVGDDPAHATRREGDAAALAFEQGTPDPALLRPADLEQASHFPSAKRRDQF